MLPYISRVNSAFVSVARLDFGVFGDYRQKRKTARFVPDRNARIGVRRKTP